MADLMKGKRGLVMGVANDRSIAWGIAKAMAAEGAELAFSYQGEAFGKRVLPLAQSLGCTRAPCPPGASAGRATAGRWDVARVSPLRNQP